MPEPATWQCPDCDTWNDTSTDQTCMVCDHPQEQQ